MPSSLKVRIENHTGKVIYVSFLEIPTWITLLPGESQVQGLAGHAVAITVRAYRENMVYSSMFFEKRMTTDGIVVIE